MLGHPPKRLLKYSDDAHHTELCIINFFFNSTLSLYFLSILFVFLFLCNINSGKMSLNFSNNAERSGITKMLEKKPSIRCKSQQKWGRRVNIKMNSHFSNLFVSVPTRSKWQIWVRFPGVEFLGTAPSKYTLPLRATPWSCTDSN